MYLVLEGHLIRSTMLLPQGRLTYIPTDEGSGNRALIGGPKNPAHGMTMSRVLSPANSTADLNARRRES